MGMVAQTIVTNNQRNSNDTNSEFVSTKMAPQMTFFGEENGNWRYYVDDSTGVVYITYGNSYSYGITPALNADGKPITRDQLNNQ